MDRKESALLRRARSSLPDWWNGARSLEWGVLKFAWLMERGALTWEGRAHLKGARSLERGELKFAWLIEMSAPLLIRAIRARSRKMALLETYWFSIQYPDGVFQVVSMKGVAVSITGCRLETGVSQVFFYRQPSRQASTECPLSALKQLTFWMQISSQLSRFMNWSNDHCDLDLILTVCDITGWPYRGHEAALEDNMLKGGGGVYGFLWPWCGEGGWNQLLGQVEEGGPKPCVVRCGDGWILAGWKGRAKCALKVAWLIERVTRAQSCLVDWKGRAHSKWEVWWFFLLLLVAAKSWWKIDPLAVIQVYTDNSGDIFHVLFVLSE